MTEKIEVPIELLRALRDEHDDSVCENQSDVIDTLIDLLPPERKAIIDVMAEAARNAYNFRGNQWQKALKAAIEAAPVTEALLDELEAIRVTPSATVRTKVGDAYAIVRTKDRDLVAAVKRAWTEGLAE